MNSREQAYNMLKKVFFEDAYAQLVLKGGLERVDEKDRGLVTSIVYGTIQNYRYVRYIWERHITRKCKQKEIALLLDMAVYQLIFLDNVPSYAIVNETINLVKKVDFHQAGFVNGVLRQVIKDDMYEVECEDEAERISIRYSIPTWLYKMWNKQYGEDIAKQLVLSLNDAPRSCARVNTLVTTKQALIDAYGFEEGQLSKDALYYLKGSLIRLPCYELGQIAIQDEGGQMVALMSKVKEHDRVLDMCAAPGSKTMHMAALMNNTGEIIANELYEQRGDLIKEAAQRLHVENVQVINHDALALVDIYGEQSFDVVLCDAPCSGSGVMSRKPDIRLHIQPESLDEIIRIQATLLACAARLVKPNGYIVYSTCALNTKENEKQCQAFLSAHPEFVLEEEKTIFPYMYQCDGFYIARMHYVENEV